MMEIDETREAIEHLEHTDGWKLVKRYIDERITDHTDRLLTCKLEEIELNRKAIETLNLIYVHMEELKAESTEVAEHP